MGADRATDRIQPDQRVGLMTGHFPVDRCTTTAMVKGFLCNCGRTILSTGSVEHHFGKPFEEVEREMAERKGE